MGHSLFFSQKHLLQRLHPVSNGVYSRCPNKSRSLFENIWFSLEAGYIIACCRLCQHGGVPELPDTLNSYDCAQVFPVIVILDKLQIRDDSTGSGFNSPMIQLIILPCFNIFTKPDFICNTLIKLRLIVINSQKYNQLFEQLFFQLYCLTSHGVNGYNGVFQA